MGFDPFETEIKNDEGNPLSTTIADPTVPANKAGVDGPNNALKVSVVAGGTSGQQVLDDQAEAPGDTGNIAVGLDSDTSKYIFLRVTADGRLKIALEPPSAPAGSTPVDIVADGIVATVEDTFHTITNGDELLIQNFNGGGEAANGGHVIELFEDPNGDLTVLNLIRVAFIPSTGGNFSFDLKAMFIGNGVRRILVRRTRSSGGNARIAAFWSGFERTP